MEDSERKKAIELLKEMRSESKTVDAKPGNQETHLNWMYKGPSDLVDREEYLLGRAIDKNFEVLNGSSDGRLGEQSNVPKRLLEKTDNLEQVDIAKKILEDPLYAIKQKEIEARKKLLNNPVKLKQIKQMLLERSKQNNSHKLKKKKLSKQKSEQDLNFLILKILKKFTDEEKRKALNKIIKSGFDSDSAEKSSSGNRKDKKFRLHEKRSHSSGNDSGSENNSSSNSSDSDSSSSGESSKKKREKNDKKKKQNIKNKKSGSSSRSSDYEGNRKSKTKTSDIKHCRKFFDSDSKNSTINKEARKSKDKSLRNLKDFTVKNKKRDVRENSNENRQSKRTEKSIWRRSIDKRCNFSDEEHRYKRHYGLMILDGSKLEKTKREFPVQKYQKSAESKTKSVSSPKVKPLSDTERDEKLREMMENAKLRKEEREKNLANHRKKQILEEQSKTYDDDFMRRQMSNLTSRGTVADRIKSNINNIQRSNSSMEINFMRK